MSEVKEKIKTFIGQIRDKKASDAFKNLQDIVNKKQEIRKQNILDNYTIGDDNG